MKLSRYVALTAVALAIGVGALLAWQSPTLPASAPLVEYTLLDGSQHRIDQLRGKVVLVNFWATSCTTCVKEMPHIVDTHNKYQPRGYETLAVAMQYDPPTFVATFAEVHKLPFGVAIDNTGQVAKAFGDVGATPTSFLVDRQGVIVRRFVGEPDFALMHRLIESLLVS